MDLDANPIGVFKDLKPGKSCVTLIGNYEMATKMNQEIVVRLGLTR